MPNGHHDHNHGAGVATATYPQTSSPPKDCGGPPKGCGSPPPETPTCCDLVCFERPRYFCGHLLKDTDLSKEQQYILEKHKLYHRTLHGHGVVCGLRLTCDGACCGNVRIGEGYAIDDCGNDIVVCDQQPFDVIARLKQKGLLIPTVFKDPCDEETETTPCAARQCFYVVICYQETEHEFTTPLTPGCGPSPKNCEATRIRETYAFDVVDKLPPVSSPLESLQANVEHCFGLFADSPFGKELENVRRLLCPGRVVNADGVEETPATTMSYEDQHKLFCKVRGLFLLYLKKHPDQYNCRMEQDVLSAVFPTASESTKATIDQAFCRLIELAYGYALSCFFGELAFPCPEPSRASCVVLGTVEVEDGCVVRVCNCPRKYVWSFASFFQVLFASLAGSAACETREHQTVSKTHDAAGVPHVHYGDQTCCGTFRIEDCCTFLEALGKSEGSIKEVASAMFNSVAFVSESLKHAFDPTRWTVVPPAAYMNKTIDQLNAKKMADQIEFEIEPGTITDPLQVLAGSFPDEHARYAIGVNQHGRVIAAAPIPALWARLADVERQLSQLKEQISQPPVKTTKAKGTKTNGDKT